MPQSSSNKPISFSKRNRQSVDRKGSKKVPSLFISLSMLLFFIIVFSIGNKSFISPYNIKTVLNAGVILLAVGLGQCCVILTGGIDLSVGSIMSLISVSFLLTLQHIGPWAFVLCILIGCLVGIFNGFIITMFKIPSFIATLGTGGIVLSITYLIAPAPLAASAEIYHLLDIVNGSLGSIKSIWIFGIVIFSAYFILQKYTYLGRSIFYVGSNEKMSWMSGIDVEKTKILAFMLSGIGASVAGFLLASTLYSGYPTLGNVYVLQSIAVVVVGGTAMTGGVGGVVNTLVGALIMSVINNGMMIIGIDVYAQQTFLGVLIIIAVAVTFNREKVTIIK